MEVRERDDEAGGDEDAAGDEVLDDELAAEPAAEPAEEPEEPAEAEPEPTAVWPVNEWPKLSEGTQSNYMHMPVSLQVENAPYAEDALRHRLQESAEHLEGTARVIHDHPWRVIRWREVMGADGNVSMQSNARIVMWADGSQHLFLGDDTVYEITKQKIRRGVNDVYNMDPSLAFSFFAPLDEKLVFRLIKEPAGLKPKSTGKKQRKVKMVGGFSAKEEEMIMAEEERKKAQGALARAREKKQRATSSVELSSGFLEEGMGDGREGDHDPSASSSSRAKRTRSSVDESKLLEAKRKTSRARVQEAEEEEEEEEDDYDVEDDDVDDDGGDAGGGAGDDDLQLFGE